MNTIRKILVVIIIGLLATPTLAFAQEATPEPIACTSLEECQEEILKLQEENDRYKIFIEEQGLTDDFEQRAGPSKQGRPPSHAELLTASEYADRLRWAEKELACTDTAKDEIYAMYHRDGMSVEEIYAFLENKPLDPDKYNAENYFELVMLWIEAYNSEGGNAESNNAEYMKSISLQGRLTSSAQCTVEETIVWHVPGGK